MERTINNPRIEGGVGIGEWLGGRWGVTLSLISIILFGGTGCIRGKGVTQVSLKIFIIV